MSKFDKTLKLLEQVFCSPDEGDDPNDIITLPDGDKRIELDDSEAKLYFNNFDIKSSDCLFLTNKTLKDFLDYPTLYKRLPKIAETKCDILFNDKINPNYIVNGYCYTKKIIFLRDYKRNFDYTKFFALLFHEIQHVIQDILKLKRGGSFTLCEPSSDPDDIKIVKFYNSRILNKIDIYNIKSDYELKMLKMLEDMIKNKYKKSDVIMSFAIKGKLTLNFLTYIKLSGEVEAYEVQLRAKLNKEQRKSIKPDFSA